MCDNWLSMGSSHSLSSIVLALLPPPAPSVVFGINIKGILRIPLLPLNDAGPNFIDEECWTYNFFKHI